MSAQSFEVVRATEEHLDDARRWQAQWGMDPLPRDLFPSTSFVVPGLAIQSLYLTDSNLAVLETLVSNPEAPKGLRRAALDAVVERAIAEARAAEARLLTSYVRHPAVVARLQRHGFNVMNHGLVALGLAFERRS